MSTPSPAQRAALTEKLADSLSGPLPEGTPRRLFGEIRVPGKVGAIIGMRRAGKTMFLHQLRRERLAHGVARERLPYVSFEDERLADLEAPQLGFLLDEYRRRVPDDAGPVTWAFDEIQVVPGWERFVRRLLDSGGVEIFVTGSSAALLSREIATALRGRAWEIPLYPFSLAEALSHAGGTIPANPGFLSAQDRPGVERAVMAWLAAGGFPEAQGLAPATRRQLLQDYVDVAMLRDVVERHGVSNVAGLRWLVRRLLGNAGSLFSVEKFYAALKSQGIAISRDTLHQLLGYLEDCFLVRLVWMEAASERQRMVNPRKAYPVDQGLIPVFDRTGRANLGHALETAVLVELERRHCAVTYVRTAGGHEVDFLARGRAGGEWLIQVCADASDPSTASRELRALVDAGERFPRAELVLVVLNNDGMPTDAPAGVRVTTAHEWLLEAGDMA
jgi:uncharacterized protein